MVTLTQRAQQRLVVLNALERGEVLMAEAAALGTQPQGARQQSHAG